MNEWKNGAQRKWIESQKKGLERGKNRSCDVTMVKSINLTLTSLFEIINYHLIIVITSSDPKKSRIFIFYHWETLKFGKQQVRSPFKLLRYLKIKIMPFPGIWGKYKLSSFLPTFSRFWQNICLLTLFKTLISLKLEKMLV